MPALTVRQIYDVALSAGFSPQQAVTWTAIAMAESSGNPGSLNDRGEHSVGLWQVNIREGVRTNVWGDLTDPANNARAAYQISRQGQDMRPWTTTHDRNRGTGADYRRYLPGIEQEIGVEGDDRGVHGYGAKLPPPLPERSYARIDPGRDLAGAQPSTALAARQPGPDSDADGLTDSFEALVGSSAKKADSDGDRLPDAAEVSLGSDPARVDTDRDGVTDGWEARSGTDPLRGSGPGAASLAPAPAQPAAPADPYAIAGGRPLAAEPLPGTRGPDGDADADGLTDAFEKLAGTDAHRADTDRDGLGDGYEATTSRTDPLRADTDADAIADADEVGAGTDAGRVPGTAWVTGSGRSAENTRNDARDSDTDNDGLSDWLEAQQSPGLGAGLGAAGLGGGPSGPAADPLGPDGTANLGRGDAPDGTDPT